MNNEDDPVYLAVLERRQAEERLARATSRLLEAVLAGDERRLPAGAFGATTVADLEAATHQEWTWLRAQWQELARLLGGQPAGRPE